MLIGRPGQGFPPNPQVTIDATDSTLLSRFMPRLHKMHPYFFHPRAKYSWAYPNSYQLAGQSYTARIHWRHRDAMRRLWNGMDDDRYLSPFDGRVKDLVVQTTNEIYDGRTNSTWRRTYIRNVSSIIVRVAQWPFSKVPNDSIEWTRDNWITVSLWWLPTCITLLVVVCSHLLAVVSCNF